MERVRGRSEGRGWERGREKRGEKGEAVRASTRDLFAMKGMKS